jgi:very-short-patch-repair endonuclease
MNEKKTTGGHLAGQARMLEFYQEAFDYLIDGHIGRCASPIEEMFLIAMATRNMAITFKDCGETDAAEAVAHGHDPMDALELGNWLVFINEPVGPYKADILIFVGCTNNRFRVVVELDGHDFHERTKEQAAHDKKRDRWMQTEGIRVLRFTGSEVYNDPFGCVLQLQKFIGSEHVRLARAGKSVA